jgi:hypothetical protein
MATLRPHYSGSKYPPHLIISVQKSVKLQKIGCNSMTMHNAGAIHTNFKCVTKPIKMDQQTPVNNIINYHLLSTESRDF